MNMKLYKPTDLEKFITKKYKDNGIIYPFDLEIERIADIFEVEVKYYNGKPFAQWEDKIYSFIFLNIEMSKEQQREVFFHELCHPFQHAGNQRKMPELFKALQETQAGQFQLYAAMPIFLLDEFSTIKDYPIYVKTISEEFKHQSLSYRKE